MIMISVYLIIIIIIEPSGIFFPFYVLLFFHYILYYFPLTIFIALHKLFYIITLYSILQENVGFHTACNLFDALLVELQRPTRWQVDLCSSSADERAFPNS